DANPSSNSEISVGLWLDIRLGSEGQLVVSPEELLQSGPLKGKPVELSTKAETAEAGLIELSEFAQAVSTQPKALPTILNLIARRPGIGPALLDLWGPEKPFDISNVAVQSESSGILKELREAQPRALFGSSQATLIQIEVISSLGLQGLIDLKSDLLISSSEEVAREGERSPRLRPVTLSEAHRRGLRRYAGPAHSLEQAQKLFALGYDGTFLTHEAFVKEKEAFDALLAKRH
ncbi:MAG: hypothetical protein RBT63_07170, partial [Bdellovibrionales bacterium]|nr:hypothetical protein [Bdellovibrionales bacterium]